MRLTVRNHAYIGEYFKCELQEDNLSLDYRKNSPPKTAAFNPKYAGEIKRIIRDTSYLKHMQVIENANLNKQ